MIGIINSQFDIDALNFLNTSGITSSIQRLSINYLVRTLKLNNLWSKFTALYPFVGGTSTTHKYNLINPSTFTLTFNGTLTHNSNGISGNGTTGYYDTGIITNTHISRNDNCAFVWNTVTGNTGVDIGMLNALAGYQVNSKNASNQVSTRNFTSAITTLSSASDTGFSLISRTGGSTNFIQRNSTQTTINDASIALVALSIYGLALNSSGTASFFCTRTQGISGFCTGLTTAEATTLYTIIQQYQSLLSR